MATHHEIIEREQIQNKFADQPMYVRLTAVPPDEEAKPVGIERPILYVTIDTGVGVLHVINQHLKSKIPSGIPGQKVDGFT